jgi:hypothetical protein
MNDSMKLVHSRIAPKINNQSRLAPKISPDAVARAFGARAVANTAGLDVVALRDAIADKLLSHGGRPGIEGATSQIKIPRIDDDWRKLERIARTAAATLRHKPSVTQTAALVLHVALSKMSEDELETEVHRAFG